MAKAKRHSFKAQTQKVLSILTHSLYTNREIFLRELLSNSSDALDKLRFLQSKGESLRETDLPLEIRVRADKAAGILEVADTGLGMTEKELVDNLGTIAQSGSEQFLKDVGAEDKAAASDENREADDATGADQTASAAESAGDGQGESPGPASATEIIGRFGIGFYSVFMVADSVDVISRSAQGEEPAHMWSSTGAGSFTVTPLEGEEADKCKRGTIIRITLKEDAREFLEKYRLEQAIRKHSNFLPFPIFVEDEQINTTPALWREPKFSISKEQYADFYSFLTYDQKAPMDVLHLSVDAPVQFNALMFIPDTAQDLFGRQQEEWGLDLYVRRVLIEKNNSELIPQYLAFLKGVVDTEDLPLNISRESLQENIVLRKIAQTVVKQVFSHLEKMAETDKEKYENFWKLHGKYFKFAFQDFANRDRAAPLMRFSSSASDEGALIGLDAYVQRMKADQKEIWYVSAPSAEAAKVNPHMERFRRKGIEVLYLLEPVDEFALEAFGKYREHPFKSVEQAQAKDLEAFTDEEKAPEVKALSDEEKTDFDKLMEAIRGILGDKITDVRLSDRLSGSPAVLVSPDGVSSSMEKLIRVMQKEESPPKKILEVNPDHPLMRALLRMHSDNAENPLIAEFVNALFDNVLLLDGYLGDPYLMADRSLRLMDKAAAWYADLLKK